MLLGLLLTLNILVCIALIGVVLLQRSEGGALGGGGSPGGLITTRGAGDLLTRTTWILFGTFMALSLTLTLVGGRQRSSEAILKRLEHETVNPATLARPHPAAPSPAAPASGAPASPAPLGGAPAGGAPTGGFLAPPPPSLGGAAAPAGAPSR